jgi:hypothetical protein
MKITGEHHEVRGDIKRRLIANIKAKLGPAMAAWGIVAPQKIGVIYNIERLAYHVRISFGEPEIVCVDWLVDEHGDLPAGVYEEIAEQLAVDARIPIAEELYEQDSRIEGQAAGKVTAR